MELRKIQRYGNSLGVIIPVEYLMRMGVNRGDWVVMTFEGKEVRIRKLETDRILKGGENGYKE